MDEGQGMVNGPMPGRMMSGLNKLVGYSALAGGEAGAAASASKLAEPIAAAESAKVASGLSATGAKGLGMIAAGAGALILAGALIKNIQGPKDMPPENMPYADSYPGADTGAQMPLTYEMAHMPSTMVAMGGQGYSTLKPRGVMYDISANIPNPPDVGQFIDQVNGLFSMESGLPVKMNVNYSGNSRPTSQASLDDMLARKVRR
jgi:hypothetical protein